ncbi:hypothetical protein ALC57_02020 [Trachymyrmex cornetzi]|uniref:Uncharacterized protein n=1 Tax=Trachymyrmex cornetzi TaxID=471704 RepID=A0A151JP53_9HYME|nr:hypothetical protein ALC57_02020 [Trachymyrmex cornetzi]
METLRNYVYNNGLCLNPDHYDAKKRKIEHVAAPEFDTDAVNKSYVERTLRDTRNEIEESCGAIRSDMRKVRRNVEEIQRLTKVRNNVEVSKSVSALSTKVSNEIQRGVTDLRQQLRNIATFETTGRDMIVRALRDTQKDISNDVEKVRNNVEEVSKSVSALSTKVSNEIQRDVTDLRQQMLNMVTKEMIQQTLEESFKTTGKDTFTLALQNIFDDIKMLHHGVSDMRKQYRRMCVTRTRFSP